MLFHESSRFVRALCASLLAAPVFFSAASAQRSPRDSAGVRLFDYRDTPMPAPAFQISERPVRAFNGGEEMGTTISGATAITRLFDGRWIVAIASTQSRGQVVNPPPGAPPGDSSRVRIVFGEPTRVRELRIYDSLGTFLSRGGTADSTVAGHFRGTISFVREMPAGNVLVATLAGDLSVHRLDGTFERSIAMAPNDRFVGVFDDGSMMLSRARVATTPLVDGTLAGYRLHQQTTDYFRVSADGQSRVPLPVTTEQPWYVRNAAPLAGATPSAVALAPWPVSTAALAFTNRDVIWLFDRVKWELRSTNAQGVVRSIVRPPVPDQVATAVLGGRFRMDSTYAETMLVDDQGRLWMDAGDNVRLSNADYSLRRWLVVDHKTGLLGAVIMPPGFRPLEIRSALVYGWQRSTRGAPAIAAAYRIVPIRQ
ncbi:MAG: hypothetical protein IT353_03350 [Gemmatimonadaceae bacterium]|nr:hypothetical protein [Gemmatimonadaceae bacterium]